MSQHERRVHAGDYHSGLLIGHRTGNKRRWSMDEKVLLAREEVRITCGESPTELGVNAALCRVLPDRTFEAIKGLRRNPEYRALVDKMRSERDGPEPVSGDGVLPEVGRPADGGAADSVPSDLPVEGPALPTEHAEAVSALADACRRDADALCLSPDELQEVIDGAVEAVRDPACPAAGRIKTLVDQEFDQWVASLPIRGPKASPEAGLEDKATQECSENSSRKRRSRRLRGRTPNSGTTRPPNRRQLRRKLYGVLQRLYRKNRSRCAKTVLSGDWAKEKQTTTLEEQEGYWKPLFEEPSQPDSRQGRPVSRALYEISLPTDIGEYERILKSTHNSSPGLDNVDRKVLRGIDARAGVAHMNLWMLACQPPSQFKVGVTVPLPKAADAAGPAEYRPITMSSMLCRLFHRLVAHRAEQVLPLGPRQKAFREGDGLADNVWILRSLIEDCKVKCHPLCVTFVDVRKAFDTVSHESIVKAAERIGFPPGLVAYIRCLYTDGVTQLRVGRTLGSLIRPRRGVRQGDPLSPLLFCAVMDWVLSQLDQRLGVRLGGGVIVNHLAFADDVALLSSCPHGMKVLLRELECGLEKVGLRPNPVKSASFRIVATGRGRRWFCDARSYLSLGQVPVPAIDVRGSYKYLGIQTGAGQKIGDAVIHKLEEQIKQLAKAPLKPQQRLFILRCHVLPGLYHELVLSKASKALWRYLDRLSRAAVRRWLHLPHDVPQALFHAHVKEGGLGLPELLVQVPLMRRTRVEKLFDRATWDRDPVMAAVIGMSKSLKSERARFRDGVKSYSHNVTNRTTRERAAADALHNSCDGVGLTDTSAVPAVSRWVSSGTALMSGRSFVSAMHVRAGCLYTKVRAARGRTDASADTVACEVCPSRRACLAHMIQQCPKSAHARNERHNTVLRMLAQKLKASGYTVLPEPAIKTDSGVLRPDVVVFKPGEEAAVVDVTIVADVPGELSSAHDRKIRKYDVPQVRTWISGQSGVPAASVFFTSLTFNWRGALCAKSAHDMRLFGIKLPMLEIMATRVLEWGHRAWREYRDSTWIRMDLVPSGTGRSRDSGVPGRTGGRRRVLAERPPRPVGLLATGRHGRPVHTAMTGRGQHCRPGPAGTGGAVPRCQ